MCADRLNLLREEASACTRCALAKTRTTVVFGSGDPHADLFIVGEAPGRDEDRDGTPFVGRSGQLLLRLVAENLGLERNDCYIANTVKCRPPDNRNPRPAELSACRPFLDDQIASVKPKVIVTLGNVATQALLSTKEGIRTLRTNVFDLAGIPVLPTLHPAAALRGGAKVVEELRSDLLRVKAYL